jgi:hypothetical protein
MPHNVILENEKSDEGFNPVLAISIIIGIAMIMVIVTFTIFVRSSAYATVKQVKDGQSIVHALDKSDLDTTSPIKPNDIDDFARSADQQLRTLDDAYDFSAIEISDKKLGL